MRVELVEGREILDDEAFALVVGFTETLDLDLGLGFGFGLEVDADADADVEGPAVAEDCRLGGLKGSCLLFWAGWRSGGMVRVCNGYACFSFQRCWWWWWWSGCYRLDFWTR